MNIYLVLILRILHIGGGVLWVGAAFLYFAYIEPTLKAIGPSGGMFMQHFTGRQKYPMFMGMVSIITVLSGFFLYVVVPGRLSLGWISQGPGLVFTIGAVASIIAFFMGFLLIKPRGERMGALSREIGMSGGPPSTSQAAELGKLNKELHSIERTEFILLSVALLTMATARYWSF